MNEPTYNGAYYKEIGNFLRESYLDYSFTKGTPHEVDFLIETFELPKGANILDIGCGVGRHSLELARRGYQTTGIDISDGFIEVAQMVAQKENLRANFYVQDARELEFENTFDAAICLCEGAFGLAGDEAGHRKILKNIYQSLKPNSTFILTALNALMGIRNADQKNYDPLTLTSTHHEVIKSPKGETREVTFYSTAFTYRELKWLLQDAGFEVINCYGCIAGDFRRKALGFEDFEIMMIAKKG